MFLLHICSDHYKSGGTLYPGVLVFFLFFSTQNQVPQIIIGLGRLINRIRVLNLIEKFPKFFSSVEINRFKVFDFSS